MVLRVSKESKVKLVPPVQLARPARKVCRVPLALTARRDRRATSDLWVYKVPREFKVKPAQQALTEHKACKVCRASKGSRVFKAKLARPEQLALKVPLARPARRVLKVTSARWVYKVPKESRVRPVQQAQQAPLALTAHKACKASKGSRVFKAKLVLPGQLARPEQLALKVPLARPARRVRKVTSDQ